jgi:uncharacterized protein (DUF1015 family)
MACILPFRGLRYNPKLVSDLASVTSLPYDVLSEKDREELYQANPYNIVRLIWGKDLPEDDTQENKYVRAGRLLQEWQQRAILIREEKAFYLYAQDFALPGQSEKSRRGIVARVKLEDPNSHTILRHESTFPVPKADRLHLLQATRANLDSIFTIYERESNKLDAILDERMKGSPLLDIRDREGVRHRLWALRRSREHQAVQEELARRQLFIADGHHRYEAALEYRREMMSQEGRVRRKEDAGYHYAMMMLVDIEDPGLIILPYHRLIGGVPGWDLKGFLGKASEYFSVEEMRTPSAEEERQSHIADRLERRGLFAHSFALYAGGNTVFFLDLKDEGIIGSLGRETHSETVRKLDVTIMDRLILHGLLGYQEPAKGGKIGYTPNMKEALRQVEDGTYDLAFLLKPTTLQEVKSICLAGERMPQKSTYFYPKLLSGLTINLHDS